MNVVELIEERRKKALGAYEEHMVSVFEKEFWAQPTEPADACDRPIIVEDE